MILVQFAHQVQNTQGRSSTKLDHDDSAYNVITLEAEAGGFFYKFENCLGHIAAYYHKMKPRGRKKTVT